MEAVAGEPGDVQPASFNQPVREWLHQLTSRELMDALLAADMPMGGTNEERIARLLSVVQPQDVAQFLPRTALQRVLSAGG